MEVELKKNEIYNQEINSKIAHLKIKIFDYFYCILNRKNKTSVYTLGFLHILEIFQILSYAFFHPHLRNWKISDKSIEKISEIMSGFRIAPLINYASYKFYIFTLSIIIFLIFGYFLGLVMQILFKKENSKLYKGLLSITHVSIAPLTIFLYIPINELLFLIFNCHNDKMGIENHPIKCWNSMHLLFIVLSCFAITLFILSLVILNFFYYYPFQTETSTIKLNSTVELIFLIIKLIYTIKLSLVHNENISIAILLIFALFISVKEINYPTYNSVLLEIVINIRNNLMLWTFFMLFIAILCKNKEINGLIYLVFIAYPLIIYISIIFTKEYENELHFQNSNAFHNIKSCISKTRFLIKLIDSFLEKNNYNRKDLEFGKKNDLVLKGMIKIHTEICLDEECPLKKFLKNSGNFNVQKQCLLNYMTLYFNKVMKNFPDNKILRLYSIQFNFNKKYNLNSVRANLEYVKNIRNDIKDEFIIYFLENEILKVKNKANINEGNEYENEFINLEQNYKRLRELIINSTKLYAEFWGIFSNNITNNLNLFKLHKIGEQLYKFLQEIKYLWENNLKNKKIDLENEYIAQLYSIFLREILWDKKESEEIQKKINEEYNILGYKRLNKENKKSDNLENIIENQDYIMLVNSNEKGKCTIFQFSKSLSYLIGYQKHEIINKPIEILMPSMFIDGHAKKVEEFIKNNHLNKISEKESFRGIEKKKTFILIKSKMGYLIPFNAKFTVFDDNDFSNSFVIKANLEARDAKSMYAYYILTKDDFSVDNFSSSAINLGLTMDLLKKYVIKLNILIRTSKDNDANLVEQYKTYLEEPKKILWVYPDVIYPKNDFSKNKDKRLEDLIKISDKKRFNLQIYEMKYKENKIIGFVFKFIEIKKKKNKNEIIFQDLIPHNNIHEVLFDLLELKYIRIVKVIKKSGFRNLRDQNEENEIKMEFSTKTKRDGEEYAFLEGLNDELNEEDEEKEVVLTKDKILELQGRDSHGINNYINLLHFYATDISYIKHRPNKEEYIAGKIREPLIKIEVNKFINRIENRMKESPSFSKKKIHHQKRKSLSITDINLKTKFISSILKNNEIDNKEKKEEEININLINDSSITLSNIFNHKSIFYIKIINLIIYIFSISILSLEFSLTYIDIDNNRKKFDYLDNSYKILINMVYTKYFITEAILSNTVKDYLMANIYGKKEYINYLKIEMSKCHQEFIYLRDIFNSKNVKMSKKFNDLVLYNNLTIRTLTNKISKEEELPFLEAMNRYASAIFYVSTISESNSINMTDKYSFELMINILNNYYLTSVNASILILEDINHSIRNQGSSTKLIIIISLIIIIFLVIEFYRIMINFMHDREKPINLFLTIKKKLFEDLKISAENFSNKLLNKFFGNEENEEESNHEYVTNVKANDINIAKFNSSEQYQNSNNNEEFRYSFILLVMLSLLYEIYLIFKYLNSNQYFKQIDKFIEVYNMTVVSHLYIGVKINVLKQYLFNDTLPVFSLRGSFINFAFYKNFHSLTNEFAIALLITSKTNSFLKSIYKDLFKKYFYGDFSNLTNIENFNNNNSYLNDKIKNGFKTIIMDLIEKLRILFLQYFLKNTREDSEINVSSLVNDKRWHESHELLIYFIKPWYNGIMELINSIFYSLVDKLQAIYISIYIFLLVFITLIYCIIRKIYEERLHNLLKKSFDLINLIPKEIKYIIVSKLNE